MNLPTVTDCKDCGVCCRHMGYPSFVYGLANQPDEEHWGRLPTDLKESLLAYIDQYEAPPDGQLDGPCLWLDTASGRCKHHEFRPQVCRDFRVGSRGCLEWRRAYLVSSRA